MGILDLIRAQLPEPTPTKLAVSHRPDLDFREHILRQTGVGVAQSLVDSYAGYANVYKVHVWVKKAITVIANNIAPLPVAIVAADDTTIVNHELADVFTKPNDTTSQSELWESYVVDMLLGGESFFEIVDDARGRPVEFWQRRPDIVSIAPDVSPDRALFPRVAGYSLNDSDDLIPPENMIHDKFNNPLNPWRGVAPITAIRSSLTIDMFAAAWSKTFLRSGARPDYAVIAPNGITPTERDDIETALIRKFGGSDNWHKPIVLEDGVTDIKRLSFAPKDIEWLEQRKFARDEIGGVFGVPDEVMGYGRDTYENMDAAHRWLWLLTLVPLIRRRDDRLTKFFTMERPLLRPGERFKTDLTNIAALQDDIAPLVESAARLWSMGVPFNTIDERLGLGIGDVPGGNVGYVPFNLIPAGSSAERTEPVNGNGTGERSLARLVSDAVAAAIKPNPQQLQLPEIVNPRPIEFGSDLHKNMWKQFDQRVDPHVNRMQRQLKREIQRQQNETLRAIRQLDGPPTSGELFDVRAETAKFADNFRPHFESAVDDFGGAAFDDVRETAKGKYTTFLKQDEFDGLALAFDVTDPEIQAVIDQMSFRFGRDISRTTGERIGEAIRPILDQAATEGWSIPRMQQAIYSEVSIVFDVRKSDYETERIARTEMNRAANNGNIQGWRQSGVVRGKSWLAALDNRTRDTHISAHNDYQRDPIALEADFEVGGGSGPHPGAIGIAAEDINCRCTMVSVLK